MLQVVDLEKKFGAVKALRNASLKIEKGEVRALLGANGSGKSTLVKVLSGLNKKDGGRIYLNQEEIEINSPIASKKYGIAMAYQDMSLIPELTLEENLVLGSELKGKLAAVSRKERREYAERLIRELGIHAGPGTRVREIDLSNQGLIEVAKAMYIRPSLLILDEITASMHRAQVESLFKFLNKEREKGLSVLFVSHRFEEVYELCRSATILRGGVSVQDVQLAETPADKLVYYMTGEEMKAEHGKMQVGRRECSRTLMEIKNLTIESQIKQISMTVNAGEIIGIAGLQGQGQSEFLRALYGACQYQEGMITIDDKEIRLRTPKDAVKAGIGFISGDREKEQILQIRSVVENLLTVEHAMERISRIQSPKREENIAEELINKLNVIADGTKAAADSLSGGNQQKLVVGRWLNRNLKILLLDDPTKGVDVKARGEINRLFRDMADKGTAILYSSSDNEELLELAEKIYVFYEGSIIRVLSGEEMNKEALARAMLGVAEGGVDI